MQEHFGDVLKEYVKSAGQTSGRLAKICGISKTTIDSWLEGRVKRPRHYQDILIIARALRLRVKEVERLLQSAHHQEMGLLEQEAIEKNDIELIELIAFWQAVEDEHPHAQIKSYIPFQVPLRPHYFCGRTQLINNIETVLVKEGTIGLIRGMGGVGKTALAKSIAYRLRYAFPDGVLWANLDGAIVDGKLDRTFIGSRQKAFLQAYGRNIDNVDDIEGYGAILREVLAYKRVLIILDNAYGTEDVRPLLPSSSSPCSVLITTRNRKMLQTDARTFDVEPLQVSESLILLRQLVKSPFSDAERVWLVKIIELVGGLPLALNIIGQTLSEAKGLSPKDYYEQLKNERNQLERFVDWEDTTKDVRASFELSFKRLPPALQNLFALLHLFVGSDFDIDAIASLSALDRVLVMQHMGRLFSLSLVEAGMFLPSSEKSADSLPRRYRLHPLLNAFSLEKYEASGIDLGSAMSRLVSHYLNYTEKYRFTGFELLQAERENILGAFNWAEMNDNATSFVSGIGNLTSINLGTYGFLDAGGYWHQALELLERTLGNFDPTEQPLLKAEVLCKMGAFSLRCSNLEQAEKYINESLLLLKYQPSDERVAIASAYNCELMSQIALQSTGEKAIQWASKGVALLKKAETQAAKYEEGYLRIRYASILARANQVQQAETETEAGLSRLPKKPTAARVSGLTNLGIINAIQGRSETAISYWQEGINEANLLGDRRRLADLSSNIGSANTRHGHFANAIEEKMKTLELYRGMGDIAGECLIRSNIAEDYLYLRQGHEAERHLKRGLELANAHTLMDKQALLLTNLVRLNLDTDNMGKAKKYLTQASRICQQLNSGIYSLELQRLRAELKLLDDSNNVTANLLAELLQNVQDRLEMGLLWRLQGDIMCSLGEFSEAQNAYEDSIDIFAGFNEFELAQTFMAQAKSCIKHDKRSQGSTILMRTIAIFQQLQLAPYIHEAETILSKLR